MDKDKRKGFRAGYKKLGPTSRFVIQFSVIVFILGVVFFLIQFFTGASKGLQLEAQKDRNNKHEKEINHLESMETKMDLLVSSEEEKQEIIKKISSNVGEDKILRELFLRHDIRELVKYYPSGYKQEGPFHYPTDISKKLKLVFEFMKTNNLKAIKGSQFNEMNALLTEVIKAEPLLPYAWFYRGIFFLYSKPNNNAELQDILLKAAHADFERSEKLFNFLLSEYSRDPFLLLYKGMLLTHLSKGEESIICLRKAIQADPDIFKKHNLLGIIVYWSQIDQDFIGEWENASIKYKKFS